MPLEVLILLLCIVLGAAIQVGIGIGFSIVVAPLMMILLGTATAVPVLLMLNTLVSAVAIDLKLWHRESKLISNAIISCLVGILIGLMIYHLLSESLVLTLTAGLLLIGVITSVLPKWLAIGPSGFKSISGLSGLATVWAATPGPLMVLGLLAIGRSAHDTRTLVQPIAFVAYGAAFILHCVSEWAPFAQAQRLPEFALAALFGSLLGRLLGPRLPQGAIAMSIRVISIFACAALFQQAYRVR